ncbi:HAMP domain-containing histidine kinase [Actinomadura sp. PM05-2]|uniref:histidine kinase n=1 Tax=Actinomadura parmotrematis TaxID=2864039 RepID=A0ABS7FS97_9ACTN|nr:HAMP domain-containing histidine kinase [Actinomadura parmotrematis]
MLYSVRGRATVLTVTLSAAVGLVCLALSLLLIRDYAYNQAAERAAPTVERVVREVYQGRLANPIPVGPDDVPLIQVVAGDGAVLAASPDLRGRPSLVPHAVRENEILVNRQVCDRGDCIWVVGLRLGGTRYGGDVMVYAGERPALLLRGWRLVAEGVALLLLVLAVIGAWTWWTIGRALAPVERIRSRMAEITLSELDQRVPVPSTGGEIQRLAETVNATLGRLEDATGRERRFISDASHDLRNPIAGLHTRLEVLLEEDDGHDWKPEVRAALLDTDRLNDIVSDLLELSRLDARAPAPAERVDLARLAEREVERRPQRVPITTRVVYGAVVEANVLRLARVLGNLLSNAERHAASAVEVSVRAEGGEAVLEVADDGAGVPPESRERVFERFARLPESRRRDPGGTGLGLPIAREIAQTYGGSLTIADSGRGARFVLRLPLADPPDPAPPAAAS